MGVGVQHLCYAVEQAERALADDILVGLEVVGDIGVGPGALVDGIDN